MSERKTALKEGIWRQKEFVSLFFNFSTSNNLRFLLVSGKKLLFVFKIYMRYVSTIIILVCCVFHVSSPAETQNAIWLWILMMLASCCCKNNRFKRGSSNSGGNDGNGGSEGKNRQTWNIRWYCGLHQFTVCCDVWLYARNSLHCSCPVTQKRLC